MKKIFVDAQYWVAILHAKDQSHEKAESINRSLGHATLVTTDEVLTEVLAFFSERGRHLRQMVVASIEEILSEPHIIVHSQSHQTFLDGFAFYKSRLDKGYSLIDCVSMIRMRLDGIDEILTNDEHFTQEGFIRLL